MGDNGNKTIEELAAAEVFKGVVVKLSTLQRQDGMIPEAIDKSFTRNAGVLQSIMTANTDEEYRQILQFVRWKNPQEQDIYVKAIAVCRITGAKNGLKTLLDMLSAKRAGFDGALMHEIEDAIGRTTFISKQEQKGKYDGNKPKTNSPITG